MLPAHILLTALAVQLIYILINWYFFRRKEYVQYTLYILAITAYFLNKYLADTKGIVQVSFVSYHTAIPDTILAVLSYVFYFKFGRYFIEAATRYPKINQLLKYSEKILLIYVVAEALLSFLGKVEFKNAIFIPVNLAIFSVLIIVFIVMIRRNEMLDRFILVGSMFYGLTALITFFRGQGQPPQEYNHIIFLQIGTVVEMILLNTGLIYKSRMLHNQALSSQSRLIEGYKEKEALLLQLTSLRERISRDLHDDIGATLSSVKAYSEIMKENPGNRFIAELITDNSTEMIERLEIIAWGTDPGHDSMKSLKSQMTRFAISICHSQKVQFSLLTQDTNDDLQMPGEVRQNVYLIFKEAINNMIKYAKATECKAELYIQENQFSMCVKDNGSGFDGKIKGTGAGWKNMKKRAVEINGELKIESAASLGTTVFLSIPYPFTIPSLSNITLTIGQ